MNYLEKLNALLTKDGRQIKYGAFGEESQDPLITLQRGESAGTAHHLTDQSDAGYPTVVVSVYGSDYVAAFDLAEKIKSEIKNARKETIGILHTKDMASTQTADRSRYVFQSYFKIII